MLLFRREYGPDLREIYDCKDLTLGKFRIVIVQALIQIGLKVGGGGWGVQWAKIVYLQEYSETNFS